MIGIYKITNPTGKVYVGQSIDIENRFQEYKLLKNCKGQHHLYRSLKLYDVSNHVFEILEECTEEELNKKERYWQDYYNVLQTGLNCKLTTTHDKSGKLAEGVKAKIKKTLAAKQYKHDDATRQKISDSKRGKKRSAATRKAISKAKKGKKTAPRSSEFVAQLKERLKGVPKPRIECPHCNLQGSPNNMKKWHFDNCLTLASLKKHKGTKRINKYPTVKCPHCDVVGVRANMNRWHFQNCKNIKQ